MLLVLMTFLPLVGIPLLWLTNSVKGQRAIAAGMSAVVMLLTFVLYAQFEPGAADFGGSPFGVDLAWISAGDMDIRFAMDVDALSVLMLVLTGILGFVACLAAFGIEDRPRGFFAMYLLLLTGMIGTFVAADLFLFYVFWELMLLPMYFLIGIWGGKQREYAAIKFFLYTLVGSVLMLGAFLAIYFQLGTFSIPEIAARSGEIFAGDPGLRLLLFALLFIGFAIKVPVFPFHTWLPLAHVQAPTPISVILAGVLLKLGGYGLMRMAYPWFPDAVVSAWPVLATLAVVSIVYGAFCALAQTDWKKLVAYSSVSHMGYVILGLSALTAEGVNGAVLQMFNHGTISGMMFLLVGVLYDQVHHRDMDRFGGILSQLPKYSFVAMIAFFGALGLPGLSGFISEMMVFFGAFKSDLANAKVFTVLGTAGIVFGAVYILVMIQKIFLGKPREKHAHELHDLSLTGREFATLAPLAAITIFLGIYPKPALDLINPRITEWLKPFEAEIRLVEDDQDTGALPAELLRADDENAIDEDSVDEDEE